MDSKRFSKKDDGFICSHCASKVEPLGYTSRDHCPVCLWSMHVDVNPGDRACECRGALEPISAVTDPRKGYIIIYRCTKCGAIKRNKAAHQAKVQPDDLDKIIALTAQHPLEK